LFVIIGTIAGPVQGAAGERSRSVPVRAYADVEMRYSAGSLSVVRITRGSFGRPTSLRRYRGRFEAQARKGDKLLETARFDFPLLADAETEDVAPDARAAAAKIRSRAEVTTTVRVPLPEGCDQIVVVDTKTHAQVRVELRP